MQIDALQIKISDEDKDFIVNKIKSILDSNIAWTNATIVKEFEREFRKRYISKNSIAISTGSTAIEASIIALNRENTIVYTQALTAPPTVLSALSAKCKVVLVDSQKDDFGMDINDLKRKILKYGSNGVIIPVHIGGIISKNILDVVEIGKEFDMPIIEDCAHAHGSSIFGKRAGTFGDIGTFSYFLTKTLTSGEGGIVITDNDELASKIKMIRNYGKDNAGDHVIRGSSWRMNEFTAAVALNQTNNEEKIIAEKLRLAKIYDKRLSDSKYYNIVRGECNSGYYKYIIVPKNYKTFNYKNINDKLKKLYNINLPARVYEKLSNEEPYLKDNENVLNRFDNFEVAKFLSQNHICLPIYLGMTDNQVNYICDSLESCYE